MERLHAAFLVAKLVASGFRVHQMLIHSSMGHQVPEISALPLPCP